jgi:hypothetical protein
MSSAFILLSYPSEGLQDLTIAIVWTWIAYQAHSILDLSRSSLSDVHRLHPSGIQCTVSLPYRMFELVRFFQFVLVSSSFVAETSFVPASESANAGMDNPHSLEMVLTIHCTLLVVL